MATKMLESSAVSAFCESVAVMHSAGIQMDEAVFLLGENMEDAAFKRACDDVYKELIVGKPLALAMDDSGCFPSHVVDMVGARRARGPLRERAVELGEILRRGRSPVRQDKERDRLPGCAAVRHVGNPAVHRHRDSTRVRGCVPWPHRQLDGRAPSDT